MSALYGLIPAEQEIDTYDLTLADLGPLERERWAVDVARSLDRVVQPREPVIALAGAEYLTWLHHTRARVRPMLDGLQLGERRRVARCFTRGAA